MRASTTWAIPLAEAQRERPPEDWRVRVADDYIIEEGEGWRWIFTGTGEWLDAGCKAPCCNPAPSAPRPGWRFPDWLLTAAGIAWAAVSLWLALR